jgi:hypothetical protein
MRAAYTQAIAGRTDFELAETFFNSATRRIFDTVGVDPKIEYVDSDFDAPPPPPDERVYRRYVLRESVAALVRDLLADYAFPFPRNLDLDARTAADASRPSAAPRGGRAVEARDPQAGLLPQQGRLPPETSAATASCPGPRPAHTDGGIVRTRRC